MWYFDVLLCCDSDVILSLSPRYDEELGVARTHPSLLALVNLKDTWVRLVCYVIPAHAQAIYIRYDACVITYARAQSWTLPPGEQ